MKEKERSIVSDSPIGPVRGTTSVILRRIDGFSLVEVLVVICLMGILAGVAVTTLKLQMPRFRLSGAARKVMTDLLLVRAQAVSRNYQMLVSFPTNHQYTVVDDRNNNGVADMGEPTKTINIQDSYYDVSLAAPASIIFKPLGTMNAGAVITVTNSSGTKTVLVSMAGRVRIN